jgi:hypothetical protein
MTFARYGSWWLAIVGSAAAFAAQAGQADIKPFAAQYVAAFNAKDASRLVALYGSGARACLAAEKTNARDFYDFTLAMMWRDVISAQHTATLSPVNEGNLKAVETFGHFPVKPTHELHIDYQEGDDSNTIIVYLVQENGVWRADQPCASEGYIKQFRAETPARNARLAHFKALAAAMREPLRAQLMALLRDHKTGTATDRYKDASGQDMQTSMFVIDQLAHEGR